MNIPPARFFPHIGHAQLRLLAWIGLFSLMVFGRYDRYYLAPWNIYLMAVTLLFLGLLAVTSIFPARARAANPPPASPGHGLRAWLETVCHFLPLILFAAVGPSSPDFAVMSSAAFMARAPEEEAAAAVAENVRQLKPGDYLSVSLIDLRTARDRLENTPIEVLGKTHFITDNDRRQFPSGAEKLNIRVLLYRYVITCCVADATPVSVVLAGVDINTLRDEQWYRVRGRSHFVAEGLDAPFVTSDSLEPIEEPISPFLNAVDELFR